jgi:hypothetical protein
MRIERQRDRETEQLSEMDWSTGIHSGTRECVSAGVTHERSEVTRQ